MPKVFPTNAKDISAISREWDRLAELRHRQIATRSDISFHYIVAPTLLELIADENRSCTIDAGAGTGEFTRMLSEASAQVIAVEPSKTSVEVAKKQVGDDSNVLFINKSMEAAAAEIGHSRATCAVACMSLMSVPSLDEFLNCISNCLMVGASFSAIFIHPFFWAQYWGYAREPWFKYDEEIFIEGPFSISKATTTIVTTHVHRPLERYFNAASKAGFKLEATREPMPTKDVQVLYPKPWRYPRFIACRWRRDRR